MKLSPDELQLFHRLHSNLMQYALGKAAQTVFQQRDQGAFIAARDSLFRNPRRITTFVKRNPFDFTPEELEIVSDWKKARHGTFFITRSLKSHTLFVESTPQYKPTGKIFAVVDLEVPFKKIVQTPLPVVVHTLLLPFKGRIVFDGMMMFHQVDLGSDVRDIAIRRSEVITSRLMA